jgi:hypothetical protein
MPTFRGVSTIFDSASAVTNVTVNVPSGLTQGDIWLAHIVVYDKVSNAPSAPTGWNLIRHDGPGTTNNSTSWFYWKKAGASETAATFTISSQYAMSCSIAYSAADESTPIDVTGGQSGTSSSPSSPSVTPRQNGDILVALYMGQAASAPTCTLSGSLTSRYNNASTKEGFTLACGDVAAPAAATSSSAYAAGWSGAGIVSESATTILIPPPLEDATPASGPRSAKSAPARYRTLTARSIGGETSPFTIVDEDVGRPLIRRWGHLSTKTLIALGQDEQLPTDQADEPSTSSPLTRTHRYRVAKSIGEDQPPLVTDEPDALPRVFRTLRPTRRMMSNDQELYAAPIVDEPSALPLINRLSRFWPSWRPVGIEEQPYLAPTTDEPNALPRTRRFLRLRPTRLSVGDEQQSHTSPTVDEDVGQPRPSRFNAYRPTKKLIGDEQQVPLPVDDDRRFPDRRFPTMRMQRNQQSEEPLASGFEDPGQTATSTRFPKIKRWSQSSSDDSQSLTIGDDGVSGFSTRTPKLRNFIARIVGWAEDFFFPPFRPSPVVLTLIMPLCKELGLNAPLNTGLLLTLELSQCKVLYMPGTMSIPLRMPLSQQLKLHMPLQ